MVRTHVVLDGKQVLHKKSPILNLRVQLRRSCALPKSSNRMVVLLSKLVFQPRKKEINAWKFSICAFKRRPFFFNMPFRKTTVNTITKLSREILTPRLSSSSREKTLSGTVTIACENDLLGLALWTLWCRRVCFLSSDLSIVTQAFVNKNFLAALLSPSPSFHGTGLYSQRRSRSLAKKGRSGDHFSVFFLLILSNKALTIDTFDEFVLAWQGIYNLSITYWVCIRSRRLRQRSNDDQFVCRCLSASSVCFHGRTNRHVH